MREVFQKLGGIFIPSTKIVDVQNYETEVLLRSNSGDEIVCKKLILTCGAWAKGLLANLGLQESLKP